MGSSPTTGIIFHMFEHSMGCFPTLLSTFAGPGSLQITNLGFKSQHCTRIYLNVMRDQHSVSLDVHLSIISKPPADKFSYTGYCCC